MNLVDADPANRGPHPPGAGAGKVTQRRSEALLTTTHCGSQTQPQHRERSGVEGLRAASQPAARRPPSVTKK